MECHGDSTADVGDHDTGDVSHGVTGDSSESVYSLFEPDNLQVCQVTGDIIVHSAADVGAAITDDVSGDSIVGNEGVRNQYVTQPIVADLFSPTMAVDQPLGCAKGYSTGFG